MKDRIKMVRMCCSLALIAALTSGGATLAAPRPAKTPAQTAPRSPLKQEKWSKATLKLGGMHCEGCAQTITGDLKKLRGVKAASVDFKGRTAVVRYDPTVCRPDDLLAAVKKSGYGAYLKP